MIIIAAGRALYGPESVPAVCRPIQRLRRHIHDIGIVGIRENFAEVPVPCYAVILRGPLPSGSRVIRAVQAARFFLSFQYEIDAAATHSGGDGDASPSPVAGGKTVPSDLCPGDSAVDRFIYTTARTKHRPLLPGLSNYLPQSGIDHAGIFRFESQIHSAGKVVLVQHLLPRLAAVHGTQNPALLVRPEFMPDRSHQHDVRVPRLPPHQTNVA